MKRVTSSVHYHTSPNWNLLPMFGTKTRKIILRNEERQESPSETLQVRNILPAVAQIISGHEDVLSTHIYPCCVDIYQEMRSQCGHHFVC
jgi:hypothetical protein